MIAVDMRSDTIAVDAARDQTLDAAIDQALADGKCAFHYTSGVAFDCTDGGVATTACPFGSSGDRCLAPRSCATPGDVSAGGSYIGISAGFANTTAGSCGAGGPDFVTIFTQPSWRSVEIDDANTLYDAVLYLRQQCASPSSELPLAGPCPGAATSPGTACSSTTPAKLVACGLPPGGYFAVSVHRSDPWHLRCGRQQRRSGLAA